jgi:hypothetical protein
MSTMNNFTRNDQLDNEAYQTAEKRVKAKIGFRWHLASYLVINTFLIGTYPITCWDGNNWNWSYPWFVWTLGGWGIGLMFNFLAVYVFQDDNATRQRMIYEEMQRHSVPNPNYTPTVLNHQSEQPIPKPDVVEHK